MTRKSAIKALFNQARTEAIFGTESARISRERRARRETAIAKRYNK